MTIILRTPAAGKSKKSLESALNEDPSKVRFEDPSFFFPKPSFTGDTIEDGASFPVVMDPETRRRFSTVARKGGVFKVT